MPLHEGDPRRGNPEFAYADHKRQVEEMLAEAMGKPVLRLPAWLLKVLFGVARPLGLSRYGPEQVRFCNTGQCWPTMR